MQPSVLRRLRLYCNRLQLCSITSSTDIFVGVLLTQSSEFQKLVGKAKISLCDNSYRALGLEGDVPGLGFKDFANQAKNAEIIKTSDRYVVF